MPGISELIILSAESLFFLGLKKPGGSEVKILSPNESSFKPISININKLFLGLNVYKQQGS